MTDQTVATNAETTPENRAAFPLARTLVWLGIAGASAALTYAVLRLTLQRAAPSDETTQRVQGLIDEANRLLKTLDEKKNAQ